MDGRASLAQLAKEIKMVWDILIYAVFTVSYIVSLIMFLLKRPDKRLEKRWQRLVIKVAYPIAALIIVWLTVNLITMFKNQIG